MNCAFNLTVKLKNGNTRPRSWNTQITTIYPVVYHGKKKKIIIITISTFGLDGRRSPSEMFCIFTLLARVWRPLHHWWCHGTLYDSGQSLGSALRRHQTRPRVVYVALLFGFVACAVPTFPLHLHILSFAIISSVLALETTRPCVLLCPLRRHRKKKLI